jgi:hypothetical protein
VCIKQGDKNYCKNYHSGSTPYLDKITGGHEGGMDENGNKKQQFISCLYEKARGSVRREVL